MDLAEHQRLAAAQGSPSPAPRPRDNSIGSEHRTLRHLFPQRPIDLGRLGAKPAAAAAARGQEGTNIGLQPNLELQPRKFRGLSDKEKEKEFDAMDNLFEACLEKEKNGPFAQRKLYSKNGRSVTPASRRSTSALAAANANGDAPRSWGASATVDRDWITRFADKPDLATAFNQRNLSVQTNDNPVARNPSPGFLPPRPATMAPSTDNKGFSGWQVDDEFTGRDFQVSTSPPVKWQRSNTRLDEIRQWEIDAGRRSPYYKPNTGDEIARAVSSLSTQRVDRFVGVPCQPEASPIGTLQTTDRKRRVSAPTQPTIANLESEYRPNTEPDDINRAVSSWSTQRTGRFVGVPCQPEVPNIRPLHITDTKRRVSAPIQRPIANRESDNLRDLNLPKDELTEQDGEAMPNDPVMAVSSRPSRNVIENDKEKAEVGDDAASRDLLQKLARVTSSKNPNPHVPLQREDSKRQQEQDSNDSDDKAVSNGVVNGGRAEPNNATKDVGSSSKSTVGVPSLSRTSSATSVSSKHSVESHDPTARIMGEAKLFAPGDNSERGSSHGSEMGNIDADETPRPSKVNPITMPTPIVSGAFVDTPAPVGAGQRATAISSDYLSPEKATSKARDLSSSPRATKSEGDQHQERQRPNKDSRRSKSASRPRPPLRNSAKPPTVKEDLRQICLKNDIDDSELDDLTDLVMSSADPEKFLQLLKKDEITDDDVKAEEPLDNQDAQLKRLNGMSDALKTGLAGIRTAKKGIERLEDQVSRPGKDSMDPVQPVTIPAGDTYTYIQIPVPRLYRTTPRFKLTIFGLILLLLGLWQAYWIAEDVFYDQWGKQTLCYRGSPCRWDPDLPEYGYVIPVKLDEWLTGGALRPHAAHWLEEAEDGWADLLDWWTGTDIRDVHHQSIRTSAGKAQYWRRIEKKGLFPEWDPAPWMLPQIEAWEREAQAREADEARAAAMGYDDRDEVENDTESMSEDQPISFEHTDDPSDSPWW